MSSQSPFAADPAGKPGTFPCPRCGTNIKHSPKLAGKQARCPSCEATINVPALATTVGTVTAAYAPEPQATEESMPSQPSFSTKVASELSAAASAILLAPAAQPTSAGEKREWLESTSMSVATVIGVIFLWLCLPAVFVSHALAGALVAVGLFLLLLGVAIRIREELWLLRKQIHESEKRNP